MTTIVVPDEEMERRQTHSTIELAHKYAMTLAGAFENRSVPTRRAQPPSAQTLSVRDGSRLTMRCGGAPPAVAGAG